MKNPYLIPVAALALLFTPGCERKSAETTRHLEELQRKASEAEQRQKDLERQLEEQKVAAERDAIERDRLQIENDRAELERQQGEAAAAKAEEIRKREEALANREGKLQQIQANLEDKESDLSNQKAQLNDRERDLAGREALPFRDDNPQTEPVGDYGNFYDSLSSYGSWFETPDYGYVWQPVVVSDSNWRPYSRGRWVCTDRGWTWVSDEPFGWATYHYGRWALVRNRGWVWVPGTEWAPCWVSWRENGSHIGWAPLPPETMAYRNHRWDSSVDVQFGIGAGWFTFIEYRHFGSPLYQYCLPLTENPGCYSSTTNITYIHFENLQVICGGPRYKNVCDRIGRPVPFCRLVIDRHPRPVGNVIGTRPQIKGDQLFVSAPNLDAGWNGGLKPNRIKGRFDTMVVERNEPLRPEIADRYKKNREENLRIADRSINEMGGSENFRQRRIERLEENRRQVVGEIHSPDKNRETPKPVDSPKTADVRPQIPERVDRPIGNRPVPGAPPVRNRPEIPDGNEPARPGPGVPAVDPNENRRPPQPQRPAAPDEPAPIQKPRVAPQDESNQRQADRMREEQQKLAADLQQRRQQEQARQQQEDQQAREEQHRQRRAEQAAEDRKQEMEQARQRQQAEEDSRQQQQEQARQERAQQERESERARQQEESQRQQQQEQARQRQQEENQRQQEQARQRQQEENQRQRQQQEKDQKDQEEQRKRNR